MRKVYKSKKTQTIIEALKCHEVETLNRLYKTNYPKVESFVLKNNGTKADAKDIFQEAFLIVWQNIKRDKFKPKRESAFNGYLYTVAKNKWIDVLRSKRYNKTINTVQLSYFEFKDEEDQGVDENILNDKQLEHIMHAFKTLGEACKILLRKFYFEKQSMKSIAKDLQLDTASTRNKKYRCMQKLREIALSYNQKK